MKNKRIRNMCISGLIIALIIFLSVELRPAQIYHSSIFTTSEKTEIQLEVLANTMFPIDKEILAKEMISEEQRINGWKEKPVYVVNVYRTRFHYYRGWRHGSLICDENDSVL